MIDDICLPAKLVDDYKQLIGYLDTMGRAYHLMCAPEEVVVSARCLSIVFDSDRCEECGKKISEG